MTGSQASTKRAVRLPSRHRRSREMDSSLAAAAEYDAPRSPLFERLAKSSHVRQVVMNLLAQAAGAVALAVATLGMWLAEIWG